MCTIGERSKTETRNSIKDKDNFMSENPIFDHSKFTWGYSFGRPNLTNCTSFKKKRKSNKLIANGFINRASRQSRGIQRNTRLKYASRKRKGSANITPQARLAMIFLDQHKKGHNSGSLREHGYIWMSKCCLFMLLESTKLHTKSGLIRY